MKDASIAISIVIPIYNVEKYLAECLESCVKQTLKNIEIICVNDCSPDNSRAIAESFAKRDERITIIDHEKNTRQGGARNTGVKHARGEYVWFVDSDDFIAENACHFCMTVQKSTMLIFYALTQWILLMMKKILKNAFIKKVFILQIGRKTQQFL